MTRVGCRENLYEKDFEGATPHLCPCKDQTITQIVSLRTAGVDSVAAICYHRHKINLKIRKRTTYIQSHFHNNMSLLYIIIQHLFCHAWPSNFWCTHGLPVHKMWTLGCYIIDVGLSLQWSGVQPSFMPSFLMKSMLIFLTTSPSELIRKGEKRYSWNHVWFFLTNSFLSWSRKVPNKRPKTIFMQSFIESS